MGNFFPQHLLLPWMMTTHMFKARVPFVCFRLVHFTDDFTISFQLNKLVATTGN